MRSGHVVIRAIQFCLLYISTIGCLATASDLPHPLLVIVLKAQTAPGTGGAQFSGVSSPRANNLGEIVFSAALVGGASNKGAFLFRQGQLSTVALQGQIVPGLPEQTLLDFGDAAINDSSDIVFVGSIAGVPGGLGALFRKSGQNLEKLVDTKTDAPGAPGQKFSVIRSPLINNRGDIAFQADLDSNGSVFNGVWMISGGLLRQVVLANGTIPGTSQTFGAIPSFSLNNLGDVAFENAGEPNGIFLYSNGSITAIVLGRQSVPDSTLTLDIKTLPRINDRRQIVFVNGFTVVARVSSFIPNAVVQWQDGRLRKVAMTADPVPQFGNAPIGEDLGDVQINNSGVISFRARISAAASGTPEAIFTEVNGKLDLLVSEGNTVPNVGTLSFVGEVNLNDRGMVTFVSNTTEGSFGIFATQSESQRFFVPQVADGTSGGGFWVTTFVIANRSTFPASASISFWDDDGNPMRLVIQGQNAAQFSYTVQPMGILRVQTAGSGTLKAGWAAVQSDQNLAGVALYSFFDGSGAFIDEVGAPFSPDLTSMAVIAERGNNVDTGIALANPSSLGATVTLTLTDSQSSVVASTQVMLPPNGHLSKYVAQFFPALSIPSNFQGTLEVVSNQRLAGLTLRQRNSIFTSLPVIP